MPYQIIRNDIVKVEADAIVNPTDAIYSGSGGVDARIHFYAGKELRKICDSLPLLGIGDVAVTDGYQLPCKYIIHTFGPIWHGGEENERENLISCYRKSLHAAEERGCASIAFPLISSGTFGFPKRLVLRIALEAITDYLMDHDMTVYIIVYDRESFEISKRLQTDIDAFVDEHYIARDELLFDPYSYIYHAEKRTEDTSSVKEQARNSSVKADSGKSTKSLSAMLSEMGDGFAASLFHLIDERGMTDAECYHRANISRQNFSKIRTIPGYLPKKPTILALAVALKLSVGETNNLLRSAGMALSNSNKQDVIVEYFLSVKKYDMTEINEALYKNGQPCLGNVLE